MGTASSYSFAFGPLVALLVVGVLVLVLRWVAPGRPARDRSRARGRGAARTRTAAPPVPTAAGPTNGREEYGLLMPVGPPTDDATAERARRQLRAHGIRATVAT